MMNTTISPNISARGISLARLLTIGAAIALVVLTIGGALAQRMEQRAAGDRLFLGELGYGVTAPLLHIADNG